MWRMFLCDVENVFVYFFVFQAWLCAVENVFVYFFVFQAWLCAVENVFVYFFVFQAWLCDVEKTMRWTLKEVLKNCRLALKKSLTKRDKWIKEWPGQVSLFLPPFYLKSFHINM